MVKQDMSKTKIEGSASVVVNEVARLVVEVVESVSSATGVSEETVLRNIQNIIATNMLIDSGMGVAEALAVVGISDEIVKIEAITADGKVEVVR